MNRSITGTTKAIIIILLAIIPIFAFSTTKTFAHTVSDTIKENTYIPGDFELGSVFFTNTDKETRNLTISVKSYNPQTESFLDTQPFVGINKTKYTAKANEKVEIGYALTIPQDQPEGSYFNVLTIEIDNSPSDTPGNVSVKNGYGVLFAMHVHKTNSDIDSIFFDQSDTQLIIENKGFPFLSPMKIKYVYTNNSKFVFKPEGEIRITDTTGKQVEERIPINEENKSIYPGEKIEVTREINTWKDLQDTFSQKTIVARTYNGFTDNFLTNEVKVSIKEPLILGSVIATIILIAGITGIVQMTGKMIKRKSQKANSEQSE